jgi:hypothetical protein
MISKKIISNESQGYEISIHVISKIEFIFQNLFPSYKLLSIDIIFIFILLEIL